MWSVSSSEVLKVGSNPIVAIRSLTSGSAMIRATDINVINIHTDGACSMPIVAKLDELGKPAWVALAILGFMVWWPVGLATLAFIIGSGRMSCWKGGTGASMMVPVRLIRCAGT
jgi:hypothetical protein